MPNTLAPGTLVLQREARAVATLEHAHIARSYDVGPDYLVMQFLEGAPLKGPLPRDQAVAYAGQILEALEAAHAKSIVHRDLKPARGATKRSSRSGNDADPDVPLLVAARAEYATLP